METNPTKTKEKQNFTVLIDKETRTEFLSFCERCGLKKGVLAERIFRAFLSGKMFNLAQLVEIQE